MANTYAISLEGSKEILHKQVVLQEYCTTEKKNAWTQHYKNTKQIKDVPCFNKWDFNNEKPKDNSFSQQRQYFKQEQEHVFLWYLRKKSNLAVVLYENKTTLIVI